VSILIYVALDTLKNSQQRAKYLEKLKKKGKNIFQTEKLSRRKIIERRVSLHKNFFKED